MPDRQVRTFSARLERGPHEALLATLAGFYSAATRRLHVRMRDLQRRSEGEFWSSERVREENNRLKRDFTAKEGLTSRQYNSVFRSLAGAHDGVREASKARASALDERAVAVGRLIDRLEKRLAKHRDASAKIAERKRAGKPPTKAALAGLVPDPAALRHLIHQKRRKRETLRHRAREARRRSGDAIPPIVFGGASALRDRSAIHPNDRAGLAAWRRRWDAARNGQFLLIGSSDETAGNQTCQGRDLGDGRFEVSMKTPPALSGAFPDRFRFAIPAPPHGGAEIARVLSGDPEARSAVAWRFVRDPDWPDRRRLSAWRVMITITQTVPGEVRHAPLGARATLGIDLNADHLALCAVSADGNPVARKRVPLALRGLGANARREAISEAAGAAVAFAEGLGLGAIAIEKLDFARKKRDLSADLKGGRAPYARMLSALSYSKILSDLERKAQRAGLDVRSVNPAYTSLIGDVNWSGRYGMSRHLGAACAIARRAQGRSERVNYVRGLRGRRHTLPAPADTGRHIWRQWQMVAKEARHVAARPYSVSSAVPAVSEEAARSHGRGRSGDGTDARGAATPGPDQERSGLN